jgi:hypothetical protein
MLPFIRALFLVLILVLCCGCARFHLPMPAALKGYPKTSYNVKEELIVLQPYHSPDIIQQYNNAPNKRAFRDEIVYARKRAIDLHFALFQQNVYKQTAAQAIGVDWAVLGLTGATAVTGISGTQQIMAAIAGGLTGAQGKVSERLFFSNTIPVIFSKMEALRKEVLVTITSGLTKDVDQYSMMQALSDLEDYYKAGTIPEALNGIIVASGAATKQANEEIKAILSYGKDTSGDTLRKHWMPDGNTIDSAFQEQLKGWMKQNNIDIPISIFLKASEYADLRKKAVQDLNLTK